MTLPSFSIPAFSADAVSEIIRSQYGLSGKFTPLDGERDRNYRLETSGGQSWTVKIINHSEGADAAYQAEALEHIAKVDPTFPSPRLRRTSDGKLTGSISDSAGSSYAVIVLSYLRGEIVGHGKLKPELLKSIGALVARLGRALRGFVHAGPASRDLLWDNRRAPQLLDHVELLDNAADRKLAISVLSHFRDSVAAKLDGLRAQIIHGDAHPHNLLLQECKISGIIDFGDLVHGALIQDLANLCADFLEPETDFAATLHALISGYRSVTPLEEDELEVVLPLAEVRLAMTPIVAAMRSAQGAEQTVAMREISAKSFALLEQLRPKKIELENTIRRAGAFPPKTANGSAPTVDVMLQRRYHVMTDRMSLFYDPPLHLVRGEGVWLTAADGRRYLDCYNNVPHIGHCHPYVAEAIARQARRLNTNTRYITDQSIEYAERLTKLASEGLSAVVYVNSGSEANDVAWRMAKSWTGNKGAICMELAYHGITDASNAFSPGNQPENSLPPHIRTLTPPDDYRGPYHRCENDLATRYADLVDRPIKSLQESGLGVAAFIVDSAFMTNGMLEAPAGYVQAVVDKVRAAGGIFIADEVQSGFGRMGTQMWGHRHHGVVPDFITIGKPAGNGHPLGVVITRPEILEHFTKEATFFSTFGGNNVACAAGIAVLDVIRDEGLVANAKTSGAHLKAGLKKLMSKHEMIGDVRGTGLALGVELVRDRATLEPADHETKQLISMIRDEGVMVGSEGKFGNILKIRPPIVLKPEHADIAVAAVDRALARF